MHSYYQVLDPFNPSEPTNHPSAHKKPVLSMTFLSRQHTVETSQTQASLGSAPETTKNKNVRISHFRPVPWNRPQKSINNHHEFEPWKCTLHLIIYLIFCHLNTSKPGNFNIPTFDNPHPTAQQAHLSRSKSQQYFALCPACVVWKWWFAITNHQRT